jgi:hypothetical protein
MIDDQPAYHAYPLRLWRVETCHGSLRHASLEDSRTGERKGFADLTSLRAILEEQTTTDRDRRVRENPA